MVEPFLGQISLVPYNFAPRGWAFCDGQLMAISQNQALFALLGTTYGGDGRTTFALPNLKGRVPIHKGNGAGINPVRLGEMGGSELTYIHQQNLPSHTHSAEFTPTFDTNSSNGGTTADLKITEGGGNTDKASLAKSMSSTVGSGLGADKLLSTNDSIITIKNAITGIDSGGSSMTGGNVTIGNTGGNQPLQSRDPYLAMNYVIALVGTFPSRS